MGSARLAFVETSLSGLGGSAMRLARSLGVEVVFVTRGRAYYDERGVPFPTDVDEQVRCDTRSPAAVAAALDGRGVAAVLSPGEYFVEVAAEAAALLGVRGLAPGAAAAVRDKELTLRLCAAAGLPVPRFAVDSPVGYPCVVKPVDGSASAGVAFCEDLGDLLEATDRIRSALVNRRGQPLARRALVTGYVPGAELSVETLTVDCRTTVLACTDKHLAGLPQFVEVGHTVSSALPAPTLAAVSALAVDALAAIGFDVGVAHVEIRLGPDGPVLIEVNGRPAGDRIPDLVRLVTGVDPVREWVCAHLTAPAAPDRPPGTAGAAAIRYLTAAPGRVTRLSGVERAVQVPGVVDAALDVRPGDLVPPLRDSHGRVGWVLATGPDPAAAERAAEIGCGQLCVRTA